MVDRPGLAGAPLTGAANVRRRAAGPDGGAPEGIVLVGVELGTPAITFAAPEIDATCVTRE